MATFSSENIIAPGLELFSWGKIKGDQTKNYVAKLMQLVYTNNSSLNTLFSQLTDWSNGDIFNNISIKKTFDELIDKGLLNLSDYFYYNGAVQLVADFKSSPCPQLFKPANNFSALINLIQSAENILINDAGETDLEDRIPYLRGIYYGPIWSFDFNENKSWFRNYLFNKFCNPLLTGFNMPEDPRPYFKCNLFKAFFESTEVKNSNGRRIDWGHIITGLESRAHSSAISGNASILPGISSGGTGLECNTWLGDLGGGAGSVARRRVTTPNYRAINVFPAILHSFGAAVNLEGDVAAYIIGRNTGILNKVSTLTYNSSDTIASLVQSYLGTTTPSSDWLNRAELFLKMIGGTISNGALTNKSTLINSLATQIETFGSYYALNDILGKYNYDPSNPQAINLIQATSLHITGASIEVASIFINALEYGISNPNSLIRGRTDTNPTPVAQSGSTILQNIFTLVNWSNFYTEIKKDYIDDLLNRLKNIFGNVF